jgi:hypothetical protein
MKSLLVTIIVLLACIYVFSNRCDAAGFSLDKIVNTEWVKQTTLKYGFIGNFCAFQSLNGLVDGYHFRNGGGGTYLVNESNYHQYVTAQRISGVTLGWFSYANYRSADLSAFGKIRRLLGAACYGRNCFEWSYKWQRYNNPFDYTPEHNKHAIVGIGIRGGKVVDIYFGTGNFTGPLVDIGFLALGWMLMR